MVWINFNTAMHAQYERMLTEIGGGTLVNDGYEAFNAIATKDTAALTKSIVSYVKRSAGSEA